MTSMAEIATSTNTSSGTQRISTVRSTNPRFNSQVELNSAAEIGGSDGNLVGAIHRLGNHPAQAPQADQGAKRGDERRQVELRDERRVGHADHQSRREGDGRRDQENSGPHPAPGHYARGRGTGGARSGKMMLLKAMTDPTDRSIPPLMITIVMPIAKIPSIVVSVVRSCRLAAEPKLCW